jgi:hypothetical protein
MEDRSIRTAQEVLDDHLKLDEHFGAGEAWHRILEEDIRRNASEDVVALINRGACRGHDVVRALTRMLGEKLPKHGPFEYTHRIFEGRAAFLEWAHEDDKIRVRDGADSYLKDGGKIVAQSIHYTGKQE